VPRLKRNVHMVMSHSQRRRVHVVTISTVDDREGWGKNGRAKSRWRAARHREGGHAPTRAPTYVPAGEGRATRQCRHHGNEGRQGECLHAWQQQDEEAAKN
jgi:hypothetical protein